MSARNTSGSDGPSDADDADTICIVDYDTGRVTLPDAPYTPRNSPETPTCDSSTESPSPSSSSSSA